MISAVVIIDIGQSRISSQNSGDFVIIGTTSYDIDFRVSRYLQLHK